MIKKFINIDCVHIDTDSGAVHLEAVAELKHGGTKTVHTTLHLKDYWWRRGRCPAQAHQEEQGRPT